MAVVEISHEAAGRLREVIAQQGPDIAGVRIDVDHQCHCGGVKYGMALAPAQDTDERTVVDGVPLIVAPAVVRQPGIASIGYIESPLARGFTLANSEHECGGMRHD